MKRFLLLWAALLWLGVQHGIAGAAPVVIGSKRFTESYVLGEIAKRSLKDAGFTVEHRQGMGGTIILWEALSSGAIAAYPEYTGTISEEIQLSSGAIAAYPEYTGTISEEILKVKGKMPQEAMRTALAKFNIGMGGELGFNNTYTLTMRRDKAQQLGISKISDLKRHPELRVGVTHEFLKRQDGWQPLNRRYGLRMKSVRGIDHALGYAALAKSQIDLKDAYSTDAKIAENNLVVLQDDLNFFPQYKAVFLYRFDTPSQAITTLRKLEGTLDETRMIRLNAEAERTKNYALAAALYFGEGARQQAEQDSEPFWPQLMRWTGRHLMLVGVSLALAVLFGIPLGIWAGRPGVASQLILGITGVIQTIPSLALLALLVPIPFLGISPLTAIVALFLYGLLPIVRNTATGLQDIPTPVRESAAALGLEPRAQLTKIFLPVASRTILAGIKTSAIINVGTATIAALIGAGGLGEPIISGLNLNDHATILQGAIPAAILAVLVQVLFNFLDRLLIPKGLRLQDDSR